MKTILFISVAFFGGLFSSNEHSNEQAPAALDDVCRALGTGNVAELAAIMDEEVELTILDKEDLYSRADAKKALTAFFQQYTPTSFGKVHYGLSKGKDAEYCIGTLATNNGTFRVYIYVEKTAGGVLLQELKLDRS